MPEMNELCYYFRLHIKFQLAKTFLDVHKYPYKLSSDGLWGIFHEMYPKHGVHRYGPTLANWDESYPHSPRQLVVPTKSMKFHFIIGLIDAFTRGSTICSQWY